MPIGIPDLSSMLCLFLMSFLTPSNYWLIIKNQLHIAFHQFVSTRLYLWPLGRNNGCHSLFYVPQKPASTSICSFPRFVSWRISILRTITLFLWISRICGIYLWLGLCVHFYKWHFRFPAAFFFGKQGVMLLLWRSLWWCAAKLVSYQWGSLPWWCTTKWILVI